MRNVLLSGAVALLLVSCGQQNNTPVAAKPVSAASDPFTHGKNLFLQNCASCHAVKIDLVGPALAGVEQRWNDQQKLYAYIRNAPKFIYEDKYARELWEKYNRTMMTPFPDLTDGDIDAILEYVRVSSK